MWNIQNRLIHRDGEQSDGFQELLKRSDCIMGAKIPFGAMKMLSSSAAAGDVQGCECSNVTNGEFCFVSFTEKITKQTIGQNNSKEKYTCTHGGHFITSKKHRK